MECLRLVIPMDLQTATCWAFLRWANLKAMPTGIETVFLHLDFQKD